LLSRCRSLFYVPGSMPSSMEFVNPAGLINVSTHPVQDMDDESTLLPAASNHDNSGNWN
jgi:hypothetical protein